MIYVVTHKLIELELPGGYKKILVGQPATGPTPPGYIKDTGGYSISDKNKSYCELTALYWIWKNTSDEYIGLCHYRRFFQSHHLRPTPYKSYSYENMLKLLGKRDIVVAQRSYVGKKKGMTVKNAWYTDHNSRDFHELREVIADIYSDYLLAFDVVAESAYMYPANMFFASRNIADNYCRWLFKILFELESRIDISSYDNYQRRVFGFAAERLLRVWVIANELDCREVHVTNTERMLKERILVSLSNAKLRACELKLRHL